MIPAVVPPPWTLPGEGYIFGTHAPFSLTPIPLPAGSYAPSELGTTADQSEAFHGGVGLVMLVRYAGGEAGPYDELLLSPGLFRASDGSFHQTITRIYVSTEASVVSGRKNWGIPKHLACFSFTPTRPGEKRSPVLVRVAHRATADEPFFQAILSPAGRFSPSFPVSTALVSAPLSWITRGAYSARLVQPPLAPATPPDDEEQNAEGEQNATLVGSASTFIVKPSAKGWANLCRMSAVASAGGEWEGMGDGKGFPRLELVLGGRGTKMDFKMVFPAPEVVL